jgi:hypothetical protein
MTTSPLRLRFARWWLIPIAVTLVVLLPIAWYLGSPLFLNQVVRESLPPGASGATKPAASASGRFTVVDSIHKGAGTAAVVTLPGGQRLLRFEEDFTVTNGPDLFVYLSAHPEPRDSVQLHAGGAVEIARLKGNIGSQNYELPADLDLSTYTSVVIYCKQFSVVFSTATLQPAA